MTSRYSIALHDVRVSWNEKAIEIIKHVMQLYTVPLTVHLVFDQPLELESPLADFIIEQSKANKLEIVFHGLTHACSKNVSKLWVFYHKYQAEYLDNTVELREKTFQMYTSATVLLQQKIGICPPCWIATKQNFAFFKTVKPLYIEKMLSLHSQTSKVSSPVISLGSPNDSELFFLKILARLMLFFSLVSRNKTVRIAIHICDIEKPQSISFFTKMIASLNKSNYKAVLLRELL
jgi:hypothetical protein